MYRLPVNSNTACVRTAHTLHFSFKVCTATGRVCGVATHAVGGDAGYGLLRGNDGLRGFEKMKETRPSGNSDGLIVYLQVGCIA